MPENTPAAQASFRRDIELVLLGVAITDAERQRVLSTLPDTAFSKEVGPLLCSLRTGNAAALLNWMAARGIVLEKGRKVIDAAMACVLEHNEREQLTAIIRGLTHANGLPTAEMKAQILLSLKRVEEMT